MRWIAVAACLAAGNAAAAMLGDVALAVAPTIGVAARAGTVDSVRTAITGVAWRDAQRLATSQAFTIDGRGALEGLGRSDVQLRGEQQRVLEAEVAVTPALERKGIAHRLRAQFPVNTLIEQVSSVCTAEGALNGMRVYRVTLPQRRPIFMRVHWRQGVGADQVATRFSFALEHPAAWDCRATAL
jgi:hypothetical protein